METNQSELTNGLVSAAKARKLLGDVSPMTEWRWRQQFDDFPKPVLINGRKFYAKSAVLAWIEARCEEAALA